MLVVAGLRLISLAQIRTYARHRELSTYLVTAGGMVAADLLTGVASAIIVMLWRAGALRDPGGRRAGRADGDDQRDARVRRVARALAAVPPGQRVVVELHPDTSVAPLVRPHLAGLARIYEVDGARGVTRHLVPTATPATRSPGAR
ncbi:hypothetical protein ACQPZX_39120 [Actinoplanes sp. CA-142083]|uniref:hypothetical protein n=1 Tax=Actinoplanes sp. CA-142083 TaxID=3239903 RepID=UPI003D8BE1B5